MSSHVPKTRAGWYSKKYISQYFDNIYTVYIDIFYFASQKKFKCNFLPPMKRHDLDRTATVKKYVTQFSIILYNQQRYG